MDIRGQENNRHLLPSPAHSLELVHPDSPQIPFLSMSISSFMKKINQDIPSTPKPATKWRAILPDRCRAVNIFSSALRE